MAVKTTAQADQGRQIGTLITSYMVREASPLMSGGHNTIGEMIDARLRAHDEECSRRREYCREHNMPYDGPGLITELTLRLPDEE